MKQAFKNYILSQDRNENRLILALQTIHLIEELLPKANKRISKSNLILLRFCLLTLGSVLQKLPKDYTSDKPEIVAAIFTKTVKGKIQCWYNIDRFTLAHTIKVSDIIVPISSNEIISITNDIANAKNAICKYLNDNNKVNHFQGLLIPEIDLNDFIESENSSNQENIYNAISFAEKLTNDENFIRSVAHQILGSLCFVMIENNLRLILKSMDDSELKQTLQLWNVEIRLFRNMLSHLDSLSEAIIGENLKQTVLKYIRLKEVFNTQKTLTLANDIEELAPIESQEVINLSHPTYEKPRYYSNHLWSMEINKSVSQNKKFLVSLKKAVDQDVIFKNIKSISELTTAHVMAILFILAEKKKYDLFDEVIITFGKKIDPNYKVTFSIIHSDNNSRFNLLNFNFGNVVCFDYKFDLQTLEIKLINKPSKEKLPCECFFMELIQKDMKILQGLLEMGGNMSFLEKFHIKAENKITFMPFGRRINTDKQKVFDETMELFDICEHYNIKIPLERFAPFLITLCTERFPAFLAKFPEILNFEWPVTTRQIDNNIVCEKEEQMSLLACTIEENMSERVTMLILLEIAPQIIKYNGLETLQKLIFSSPKPAKVIEYLERLAYIYLTYQKDSTLKFGNTRFSDIIHLEMVYFTIFSHVLHPDNINKYPAFINFFSKGIRELIDEIVANNANKNFTLLKACFNESVKFSSDFVQFCGNNPCLIDVIYNSHQNKEMADTFLSIFKKSCLLMMIEKCNVLKQRNPHYELHELILANKPHELKAYLKNCTLDAFKLILPIEEDEKNAVFFKINRESTLNPLTISSLFNKSAHKDIEARYKELLNERLLSL